MLLSAKMLQDVADVNRFRTVNQVSARAGSTIPVYFQLLDRDADQDYSPPGRRYIPASNSTLVCSLNSVTPRKQLAFPATNPFPEDRSIWRFEIRPDDGKLAPAPGGGPIIDYSNLIPLGQPFDFNIKITDFGMVGTFGISLLLTENQSFYVTGTLNGVVPGDEVTINGVVFTAVSAGATGTQFDVGGTDSATATNLVNVIQTNSGAAQVTAVASSNVVTLTAIRTATITASSSGSIGLSNPILSIDSRVTTGWIESAISIAPSFPVI